jgi:hypothetical protein
MARSPLACRRERKLVSQPPTPDGVAVGGTRHTMTAMEGFPRKTATKIALLKAQPVGQPSGPTVAPRLGVAA